MNFDLSEDEEMLKALAERFIVDHYDIERRRGYLLKPMAFQAETGRFLANWACSPLPLTKRSAVWGWIPLASPQSLKF